MYKELTPLWKHSTIFIFSSNEDDFFTQASVTQLIGALSHGPKGPGQGTYPGCGFNPQLGHEKGRNQSVFLSPSFPLSLKNNEKKMSLGGDKTKENDFL